MRAAVGISFVLVFKGLRATVAGAVGCRRAAEPGTPALPEEAPGVDARFQGRAPGALDVVSKVGTMLLTY